MRSRLLGSNPFGSPSSDKRKGDMTELDFGKRSGLRVPPVNIGTMRLPQDADEAATLIRQAIDAGLKYIDSSRGYADCELKVARALKDGYREKVILSAKWSPWSVRVEPTDDGSADCIRRRIDEQMKRLEVDYLDFYQVWGLNSREHYDAIIAKGGILEGIRKAMDEGIVKHTGFTTHDDPENLLSYMDDIDWCEVILFTYNLLNTRYAPALAAAHKRGIGTILMNPVGGGKLAEASPVLMKLAQEVGAETVPELSIRYCLSNPNVDTIIPGFSKPSDITDSISAAEKGPFSEDEMQVISSFLGNMAQKTGAFCTACGYCTPCPHEVNIPAVMACIHDERFWGLNEAAQRRYDNIKEGKADGCQECGECEPKCTQNLSIMAEMKYARAKFGRS